MVDKWIEAAAAEVCKELDYKFTDEATAIIQRHYDAWLAAQRPGGELDQRIASYLDRKLTPAWSDEPPERDGPYFWRTCPADEPQIVIISKAIYGQVVMFADGYKKPLHQLSQGGQWQGPLEPRP